MWVVSNVLGEDWREGDLTLEQAEAIEELTGKSWLHIHPGNSAKIARRIVAVMYATRHDVDVDEALAALKPVTVTEFIGAIGTYEDLPSEYEDGFPPEAVGALTPT